MKLKKKHIIKRRRATFRQRVALALARQKAHLPSAEIRRAYNKMRKHFQTRTSLLDNIELEYLNGELKSFTYFED